MRRNPSSRSKNPSLTDELGELHRLDLATLKRRWRMLYRNEAPVRIGQALLLHAVAYRLQETALGGLKRSTRRLLERVAEDNVRLRPATETPRINPGTVLIREWHGVSHRLTVLKEGVLLRGARYRSLSEVARKITGSHCSGPRFFGLRAPAKGGDHGIIGRDWYDITCWKLTDDGRARAAALPVLASSMVRAECGADAGGPCP
jgi:hypothetical protein